MFLQIDNPRPVPVFFVVNNGSKIFCMTDFGIPGPESSNFINASSSWKNFQICCSIMEMYDNFLNSKIHSKLESEAL